MNRPAPGIQPVPSGHRRFFNAKVVVFDVACLARFRREMFSVLCYCVARSTTRTIDASHRTRMNID